jgi:Mannosyl-glycoprotein endo-beta-N-acetylglucosaminidase
VDNPKSREKPDADVLDLPANSRGQLPRRAQQDRESERNAHLDSQEPQAKRPAKPVAPPILATDIADRTRTAPQPKRTPPVTQPRTYPGQIMSGAVQRHSSEKQAGGNSVADRYLSERAVKTQRAEVRVVQAERPTVEPKMYTNAPTRVTGILNAGMERIEQAAVAKSAITQAARPQRSQRLPRAEEVVETWYVPVMGSQLGIVASVILCLVLGATLLLTPLGKTLGVYQGPAVLGAWALTFGDVVKQTFGEDTQPVIQPMREPMLATGGESSIVGPPSVTVAEIEAILASYGSPAMGSGQDFYNLGIQYGIDPAYAVAFFIHESSAGTNSGWAGWKPDGSSTHNVGNIICAGYPTCYNRFRDYGSWSEGIEDWYKLLDREYINGRGTYTVEQIIPIYAPSFENNVPGYVNAVNSLVADWREGRIP